MNQAFQQKCKEVHQAEQQLHSARCVMHFHKPSAHFIPSSTATRAWQHSTPAACARLWIESDFLSMCVKTFTMGRNALQQAYQSARTTNNGTVPQCKKLETALRKARQLLHHSERVRHNVAHRPSWRNQSAKLALSAAKRPGRPAPHPDLIYNIIIPLATNELHTTAGGDREILLLLAACCTNKDPIVCRVIADGTWTWGMIWAGGRRGAGGRDWKWSGGCSRNRSNSPTNEQLFL